MAEELGWDVARMGAEIASVAPNFALRAGVQ
jgi:hypothetical protein